VLEPFVANANGTATELASNARATGLFDGHIYVTNNATLGNNGQAQYTRIQDLTIANAATAAAMNGNGNVTLALQSGLWVRGTTTLAPEAVLNSSFNGLSQSVLAGLVTGTGGIVKHGNGAITMLNPLNDYAGGTTIWGAFIHTASSTIASAIRGAGTPFSTGDINIMPGAMLRVADNQNIASNAVTLRSDAFGLGGFALAHNGDLPEFITSGTPGPGQVKVESTGPFAGVIGLDYGFRSNPLNMAAIPGGDWWIGNSQQAEAYYFAPTIGAAASGKFLLGGGGNQNGVNFGSVLVNAGRTPLFEGLFSGGTAGQVRMEIGAATGDFINNAPSFINGNSGFIVLSTRNPDLVGDVRVNTGSQLAVGNSFALGNAHLIVNGGGLRADFGNNNFLGGAVTLNNSVTFSGDYNVVNHSTAGDLILLGNVALSNVAGAGATRTINMNTGSLAIRGVVSGAAGSNIIKIGSGNLVLSGANTYEGFTQNTAGFIFFGGDVFPNQPGPFGVSDSPLIMSGGSFRAANYQTLARDLVVNSSGTLDTSVANRVLVLGGISVTSGQTLTVGAVGADAGAFRGGVLELNGSISGAGALTIGTTGAAPAASGTVFLSGNSNGYGVNTYSGGTTIQTARVRIVGSTYFSGPATNPTAILSGPFGTGAITLAGGESNRGALFEAVGGPVTIANPFNAITVAANTSLTFGGREALTFTRDLNLNSDATARTRTFAVQNQRQPLTFDGVLSASGAAGVTLAKTGPGMLILNGVNTFATSPSLGVQITQGIVRVNGDAALGAGTHVRLNGGVLSYSQSTTNARTLVLQANSGIDVAPGQTVTLNAATTGVFGITKTGPGTLILNATNTINTLTIGGQPQLDPNVGRYSGTGGIVATTAISGTPFATSTVNISGGALALIGGDVPQALSIGTITYGAGAAIGPEHGHHHFYLDAYQCSDPGRRSPCRTLTGSHRSHTGHTLCRPDRSCEPRHD
jgi:fibronectin-binding autotransporter adhesin